MLTLGYTLSLFFIKCGKLNERIRYMRINHFAKINYLNFIKTNAIIVFHYFVFLFSFILGSLTVLFDFSFIDNSDFTVHIFDYFEQDYLSCFCNQLIFNLIVVFVIFLLSFYPFGAPFTVCVFSLYAQSVGCLVTAVCKHFGFKGVLLNVTAYIIPFAMLSFVYALISSASISFSYSVLSTVFGKTVIDIKQKAKDLLLLFIILIIVITVIASFSALLAMLFNGFITN